MTEPPAEYGIVGHPVAHSRSPFIHAMFARSTAQNMVYRMHDVHPDQLRAFVEDFWRRGGRGLNVTVPHKIAAAGLVRAMSARATRAGAVNTLSMDESGITGDNTDGAGLVRDLTVNLKLILRGSRILLVGPGGAARGVIGPLLDAAPAALVIAGRSAARAADLAGQFVADGPVTGCALDGIAPGAFNLVINATSAGLTAEVPAIPAGVLGAQTFCYDMSYAREGTAFMRWAAAQGCRRTAQGWGMLVEQAAESFALWRGVRPPTAPVLAALAAGEV
ncbi:MAG TPA: shikimate dehydrogenase [Steroidobacteraceae bacterium]|nr:shikimate dehydrogenase [Steroidobacteraceae bacterium]